MKATPAQETYIRREQIAHHSAEVLADSLGQQWDVENVGRFTPSIKCGRRYVSVTIDGTTYLATIEVEVSS